MGESDSIWSGILRGFKDLDTVGQVLLILFVVGCGAIGNAAWHNYETRKIIDKAASELLGHQKRNADAAENFVAAMRKDVEIEAAHAKQLEHYIAELHEAILMGRELHARSLKLLEEQRRGNGKP